MPDTYPLPESDPQSLGFAPKPLEHLDRLIREHIAEGRQDRGRPRAGDR